MDHPLARSTSTPAVGSRSRLWLRFRVWSVPGLLRGRERQLGKRGDVGGEPEALVVVDEGGEAPMLYLAMLYLAMSGRGILAGAEGGLAFATRYTDCPASIGARSSRRLGARDLPA